MSEAPGELTVERHVELRGRDSHPWIRRGLLVAILALPVLALLDVFGQRESSSSAVAPAAVLGVHAPRAARGGDQFTANVTVTPRRHIDDAQIVLAGGWLEQATLNGSAPQATNETSRGDRLVLGYGPLDPGDRFVVRLALQINPTAAGSRDLGVELDDTGRPLATVPRSLTVFP